MIDLFGLKQRSAPPAASAPSEEPAPRTETSRPAHGARRLWAFLLIIDALFVAVFGGLVATKVYQLWGAAQTPPSPLPPPRARPRAAKPAAPIAPIPTAPPPTASVRPPELSPPMDVAAAQPPKPSLLNPPLAGGKAKAVAAEFKLRAPHARSVQLIGAFIAHGGRQDMARRRNGVWSQKLYLKPGEYRYYFLMDGRKTLDPANQRTDRGASLLTIP